MKYEAKAVPEKVVGILCARIGYSENYFKKKKRKSELFVYNRRHRLFGAGVYLLQGFVHMTATLNER